jgi:RNA polymerase sigma factor (sigma-70 family)
MNDGQPRTDSRALLLDYARNGSEAAFSELVRRYVDLVYSTALRRVGSDAHLAQDVTQTVFLHLARKAKQLPQEVMLGGWLHGATRNAAAALARAEHRRRARERQAAQMHALNTTAPHSLDSVAPILDDAIGQLPQEDRDAILLRFFERLEFRAVGQALGSSEDAARMRVNRALDKLSALLRRRGCAWSVAALGTALAGEAVTAAPPGLAANVAAAALAAAAAGTGFTLTLLKIMAMTNLKAGALGALLLGGLGTALLVQHQSLTRLRDDNQSLRQQLAESRLENERLPRAPGDTNELARLRQNQNELLRLRGEVTVLRRGAKAAAQQAAGEARSAADPGATPVAASGVAKFEGQVRAQLGAGQTLVTGGWSTQPGKRIFLLAVPSLAGDKTNQVQIITRFVEVPDTALADFGLDALKLDADGTSLKQQILSADAAAGFWKAFQQTDGVQFLDAPGVTTLDGQTASVRSYQAQVINGATQDIGRSVTVTPVISSDKTTIDLTLQTRVTSALPK